jgi:hypothetical protein
MIKSFNELNLSKFREIQQIAKEGGEELEMNIRILSVLSDISVDDLCAMPITEVSTLMGGLAFLCEPMPAEKVANKYKIGDITLCPSFDVTKFTTAQYVDFQEFMKAPDDNQVGILSCLLVPKGKKYNVDYDIDEVRKLISDNISVTTSNAIFTFFLTRLQRSIVNTLRSSAKAVERLQPKTEEAKMKTEEAKHTIMEALRLVVGGDGSAA